MPKLDVPKLKQTENNLTSEFRRRRFLGESELVRILVSENVDYYISHGEERVVFGDKQNQEVVYALSYESMTPLEAKKQFYLHRIFKTLFPNNFPTFHTVWGADGKRNLIAGSIRERIHKKWYSGILSEWKDFLKSLGVIRHPFSDVIKECKQIGIDVSPESGSFDQHGGNFLISSGSEYYLDVINKELNFDADRLISYMRMKGYSDIQIHITEVSLRRLSELKT